MQWRKLHNFHQLALAATTVCALLYSAAAWPLVMPTAQRMHHGRVLRRWLRQAKAGRDCVQVRCFVGSIERMLLQLTCSIAMAVAHT